MKNKIITVVLALAALGGTVSAQSGKEQKDSAKNAKKAVKVFNEIVTKPDGSVPRELLDRAEAVVVCPGVVKAAFIIGGSGGRCVVTRRTTNGWSAPAFYTVGGGSFGAQIGGSKTDYLMLIMNDGGLKGLLNDEMKIGGELSAVAGPVGRTVAASTNITADAGILSYSRSKGAFVGASLNGAVLSPDNDKNKAVYNGKTAREVLSAKASEMNEIPTFVQSLPKTFNNFSPRKGDRDFEIVDGKMVNQ